MYKPNLDCVKLIQAPPGSFISLDFREKFRIEPSTNCEYDYLEIRDGPYGFSDVMGPGRFCSTKFPLDGKKLQSSGPFLWLRFRTDGTIQNSGFQAVYEFISSRDRVDKNCRVAFSVTSDKSLTESVLPKDYIKRQIDKKQPLDCTIDISSAANSQIFLRFAFLDFPEGVSCMDAFAEVYDGFTVAAWNPGKRIVKVCKRNGISTKLTSDRRVVLRFFSKTKAAFPKFSLSATTVYRGPCRSDQLDCGRSFCVAKSLRCNGRENCPNGRDEACDRRGRQEVDPGLSDAPAKETLNNERQEKILKTPKNGNVRNDLPFHSVILGVVGGLLAVFITICMTVTIGHRCGRFRSNQTERRRRKETHGASKTFSETTEAAKPSHDSSSACHELSRLLNTSAIDSNLLNGATTSVSASVSLGDDASSLASPPPPSQMLEPVFVDSSAAAREIPRKFYPEFPQSVQREFPQNFYKDQIRDIHRDSILELRKDLSSDGAIRYHDPRLLNNPCVYGVMTEISTDGSIDEAVSHNISVS